MRILLISLALSLALSPLTVTAEAPGLSLRPILRPGAEATVTDQSPPPPVVTAQTTETTETTETTVQAEQAQEKQPKGLFKMLRPKKRTERVSLFASKKNRALDKGKICGDRAIQGEAIGRVPGRIRGCGVESAVRVKSVSGVALSTPATMDCATAKSLKSWVDRGLAPAVGRRGGGVARIRVAAHYACRTRNNQKGARISEHGKGRAIDISAFTLKDGSEISVLKHWGKGWRGTALRQMHKIACGPFGTVLGPNANRFHRDHFHFDTARYRSGSYCR
ncbi:extensin-like domain-containing protein [Rhodalgimonas zhirmunskyi]|uniref:Extensin family protein n=1 Tax=Rhodalgimonas zhirmunskyi TaxID=2964767 RepID=A0AAJ1U9M3_9RHOB|nr:extensin family protein [Rhodoalgimonas zhirmunskyi]MDQ2093798.1 extensin family protein [Rhodoalgimonas zhirmunskyi]